MLFSVMNKKDIIASYIKQFIETPLVNFKPRDIDFQFIENSYIRKVYTIIWPRRAWKSYFCFQIINNLLKSWVNKKNILYFLLENDEIFPLELKDLKVIT